MTDFTIVDIANIAGVSISTVSRVLNNHPDVSAKTRARVMDIIDSNQYIPNNSARNLKRESMKAVGLVIKGLSNPFFLEMLGIVQRELEYHRYTTLLHQISSNDDEVDAAISLYKEKKPRGIIFMGGDFEHTHLKLPALDIPYVMLTITMPENRKNFSSVTVDDYAAGYNVAEYAFNAGHSRLAAIGFTPDDVSISRLRIDGFCQAMLDHGLPCGEKSVAYAGGFSRKDGYDTATRMLQSWGGERPSCLFCISDLLALGAIRAIHDAGLSVPDDISVIGFDGLEEGRYSIPSLATVKQPGAEMAHTGVKILLDIIRSGSSHKHVSFDAKIITGESFRSIGD